MKTKIKYCLMGGLIAASLTGFNSCQLESEIYDSINAGMFPQTEADAEAMVTANGYGVFQSNGYGGMFNVANGIPLVSDLLSDYGECSWRGWESVLYLSFTGNHNCNSIADNQWRWYQFLGKMTMTIDRLEQMNIDPDVKEQCLAEMHCARGWLAFCLYDFFGPVPLVDVETLKNPLEEKIVPRATEEEMKEFIVNELTQASNVLPYSYEKGNAEYGRFTRGLCNTVLMKFYMQTQQWDKAVTIGQEFIRNKDKYGYNLIPDYRDLFTLKNEKHNKTIWAVNCQRGTQEHLWHAHVLPNDYPGTDKLTKWNGWKVSWDFMHTFEKGDKRKETLIYEYTNANGQLHNETEDRKATSNLLYYGAPPCKYDYLDFAGTLGQNSETDYIIYRYADVLTLYAEAIVRNGNAITEEALGYLNQVRTRAGLEAYKMNDFTGPRDFLDKLLMERAHEFVFEGVRRQDLIRDGSYVEAMKKKAQYAGKTTLANEHYQRIPLPQYVINEGQGKIEQNPGYGN